MLRFVDNRLLLVLAVVVMLMAPVASAFACGVGSDDCCTRERIDHQREANRCGTSQALFAEPAAPLASRVPEPSSVEPTPPSELVSAVTAPMRI